MGHRYKNWRARSNAEPHNYQTLAEIIFKNRAFSPIARLEYGDWGLSAAFETISSAIKANKRIALYADYDVDGTMSCVSWIWFLRALSYDNFVYHIPDRFTEGYGVNLNALKHLVDERGAELIITMDTGITANLEAEWCKSRGVDFVCTDHHKIQPDKMPDCVILNPKLHPDPSYQELCGAGITFVLLRRLAKVFPIPEEVWTDILALTGMATICDVVPLNGVNHKLAQLGVSALTRSKRPVLQKLLKACSVQLGSMDERDVGFKLGPRINAVGRLDHAHLVIRAFAEEDSGSLIEHMEHCNERRKKIQKEIVSEAIQLGQSYINASTLFLGGDWHQGVVGIAASKVVEQFWKPTWLFQRGPGYCKGSARSIPGFDVTEAMMACSDLFTKFGGHAAAGGFSFSPENEPRIRERLQNFGNGVKAKTPHLWESVIDYDCVLPAKLLRLALLDYLDEMRPFGHQFAEPVFCLRARIEGVQFYQDAQTKKPKHTAVLVDTGGARPSKIMFFNSVHEEFSRAEHGEFLISLARNYWQGQLHLSLIGCDFRCDP